MTGRAWRPSTPTVLLGVFAALVVILIGPVQAQAAFNSQISQNISVGSATLQGPASATLAKACGGLFTDPTMTATWTVTPSTWATGYVVTPYLNGVAQPTVTVSGRATTTTTVTITRNTLFVTNQWTFTVAAGFKLWTSAPAVSPTPASVTCAVLS